MIGAQVTYIDSRELIYKKGLFKATNKAEILKYCDEKEMFIICWVDLTEEEAKEFDLYLKRDK